MQEKANPRYIATSGHALVKNLKDKVGMRVYRLEHKREREIPYTPTNTLVNQVPLLP